MGHDLNSIKKKVTDALESNDTPKPYNVWKHYKGEYYFIHSLSVRESTEDIEICYTKLGDDETIVWTRPLYEWNDVVIHNGIETRRFIKVEDDSDVKVV